MNGYPAGYSDTLIWLKENNASLYYGQKSMTFLNKLQLTNQSSQEVECRSKRARSYSTISR